MTHTMTHTENNGDTSNFYRLGALFASHTSAQLGGANAGSIHLWDKDTGWTKDFRSALPSTSTEGEYLWSLHCRHNPALQNA